MYRSPYSYEIRWKFIIRLGFQHTLTNVRSLLIQNFTRNFSVLETNPFKTRTRNDIVNSCIQTEASNT